jgi:hypothetical protein
MLYRFTAESKVVVSAGYWGGGEGGRVGGKGGGGGRGEK